MTTPAETYFAYAERGWRDAMLPRLPETVDTSGRGKAPGIRTPSGWERMEGWNDHVTTDEDVASWAETGSGICIRTKTLLAVDIDVLDKPLAERIEEEVRKAFGPAPCRVGRAPKRLLVYRAPDDAPHKKGQIKFVLPNGEAAAVEFLADGQQFVAEGTHVDTGRPYAWVRGKSLASVPRDMLCEVTAAQLAAFGEHLVQVLVARGCEIRSTLRGATPKGDELPIGDDGHAAPSVADAVRALRAIPNGPHIDRDEWVAIGHAFAAATRGDPEAADVFEAWSSDYPGHKAGEGYRLVNTIRASRVGYQWLHGEAVRRAPSDVAYELLFGDEAVEEARVERQERASRFRPLPLADLAGRKPPPWLVRDLLPRNCLSSLVAAYASFKSFVALDVALSIAYGIPWHGRKVRRGAVVYVAGEGSGGLWQRVRAWQNKRDRHDDAPFYLVDVAVPLGDPGLVKEFLAQVEALNPALIVLDTLARCMLGLDENSAADVGKAVGALDAIRQRTGATVLTVHHTGKDAAKGSRGSTAFPAAVDVELSIAVVAPRRIQVSTTKAKDHSDEEALIFDMELVEAGEVEQEDEETGELVVTTATSLVPVRVGSVTVSSGPVKTIRLRGARQVAAARLLAEMSGAQNTVTETEFRQRLLAAGVLGGDADGQRAAWSAVKKGLEGVFAVEGEELRVLVSAVEVVENGVVTRLSVW